MSSSPGRRVLRLLSCWMSCAVGASATTAAQKPSQPIFVSEPHEIEMGRTVDSCLMVTRRFLDDTAWGRYVQELGVRLAATSARPGLPWRFRVLDDTVVNAFALPGGFVYVTRGLLAHLNSEAQLASVMGHEIGHVAARHVGGQRERRELERLGLVAGTAGGFLTELYGDVEGTQALLLANSRQAEQEADALGLHYMSEAGYDPTEMVTVLRMLGRVEQLLDSSGGGDALPQWLKTHPNPERRIENIARERASLSSAGARVERDAYLAHVNGMAYGPDRRSGYFEGHRFVVPARGYQFTFPPGWWVTSTGTAARGVSPPHDAIIEFRALDEPTADSAAKSFFAKHASPRGPLTREPMNDIPIVWASFSWLPFWVKVRGSAAFIESRGTVYLLMGYTRSGSWSDYDVAIERALRSLDPVPDSVIQRTQPLRVTTFSLQQATSLTALVKTRGAPIGVEELAALNQVTADSVLPAGQPVKWIAGSKR